MAGTDQVIEALILATYGPDVSEQCKHHFRETLRGLVRLAKAEQMLQLRLDVNASIGAVDQSGNA